MADKKKPQKKAVVKKEVKDSGRVYRGELVRKVAKKLGTPIEQTDKVVKELFQVMNSELVGGKNIVLVGFGSFKTAMRAKRTGRNPQTGKPITLKAHKVVRFKPGEELKNAVKK